MQAQINTAPVAGNVLIKIFIYLDQNQAQGPVTGNVPALGNPAVLVWNFGDFVKCVFCFKETDTQFNVVMSCVDISSFVECLLTAANVTTSCFVCNIG